MLHWTAYLLSYQQHIYLLECLVCTLKIFLFACIFIDIVCYRIRICLGYDLVWFAIRIDVYLSITHINEEHNAIAGAKFSFIGRFRMVCCRFVHKVRCHTCPSSPQTVSHSQLMLLLKIFHLKQDYSVLDHK